MRDINIVKVDLLKYKDSYHILDLDSTNPVILELKNLKPNF